MKSANLFVCVLSILVLLAAGLAQSQAPFALRIVPTQAKVRAGSELRVKVVLTNTSNRNITVEFTSLLSDYEVQVRDNSGNMTPDAESKHSMERPGAVTTTGGRDTFVTLKPNESREEEIVVSQSKDMTHPGEYSVQVSRKASQALGGMVVKSNTIKMTVIP